VDVEKRLLQLAESLTEDVSERDEERFKARVYNALGLSEQLDETPEGSAAGRPAPPGGNSGKESGSCAIEPK
jgi:hypothetical protein